MSSRGTVLVVDDDADIRESLCQVLDDLGFRPITAKNGLEALQLLRELKPAPRLILLDLMMPDLNGWQFLEERRRAAALAEIPVVVMTAAKNAPVDASQVRAVLIKPITFEQLEAVLGIEPVAPPQAAVVRRVSDLVD